MSRRRLVAALLAMSMGGVLNSVVAGPTPASADTAPSGSAATVSGTGEFANLKVTVSQTKNLINQTVQVSWTGAPPPNGSTTNFLQIMQCWGDDPAGPDRTQCQFGVSGQGGDIGGRKILPNVPNSSLTDQPSSATDR